MIQIRSVPSDVHRTLKSRAALAGMSLSDYLLKEIQALVRQPTMAEFRARLEAHDGPVLDIHPADDLREERDQR